MNMYYITTYKSMYVFGFCGYSNDDYDVMLSYIEALPFFA